MQSDLQNLEESVQRRGDATRQSLIHAGLELFGEHGFNSTTTRMLCDRAGANISAIPYYFDSKKGLYLAVMEYIVGRLQEYFGETRQSIGQMMEQHDIDRAAARDAVKMMVQTMARLFVESDEPKAWVQLITREQARPTDAFDIIYNGQIKHIQRLLAVLVGACTGLDPLSDEVKIRCHTLIGQILIFILSRESILRNLEVEKLGTGHVQLIYKILLAHVDACLSVPPLQPVANNV